MPNRVNFSEITNKNTINVEAEGWIDSIAVEYGLGMHYNLPCYFWRVTGTEHTFVIPISRLEFLSSGEYAKHFKEILEGFREEYLEWKSEEFNLPWMKEYKEMFKSLILT